MKFLKTMMFLVILSLIMSSSKGIAESPTLPITAQELIVKYAVQYNTDPIVLLQVARCESKFNQKTRGDSGLAVGIFQYHDGTFSRFEKLMGEDLDKNSYHDQAKLTAWIFANHPELRTHWTTYVAIRNGGTYSFYSKLLKRHFDITCK